MSDVITKCISDNDFNNGRAVVYTDKQGNNKTLDWSNCEEVIDSGSIISRYTNRFDDVSYYST